MSEGSLVHLLPKTINLGTFANLPHHQPLDSSYFSNQGHNFDWMTLIIVARTGNPSFKSKYMSIDFNTGHIVRNIGLLNAVLFNFGNRPCSFNLCSVLLF